MARPTKLTPELIENAREYLGTDDRPGVWEDKGDVVPTIEGLCLHIGISRETSYQWEKDNDEFSDIIDKLRKEQSRKLINGALGNKFNATISKLLLSSKHGYVEKSETGITNPDGSLNPLKGLTTEELRKLAGK